MSAKKLLTDLINKVNIDPSNSRKLYFKFYECPNENYFEITFGCSQEKSLIFKEYLRKKEDKETCVERLYHRVIYELFLSVYKRIDSDTFLDNGWSEIIRIDK